MRNRYGLSRNIPEPVRRQVRQECGFGCVLCGMAIVHCEHIDPEFSDASSHDPAKIALLCASCHDHVTRGVWSKDTVMRARLEPHTLKRGYANDAFDLRDPFRLMIGSNSIENVRSVIRKGATDHWFTITRDPSQDSPLLISARFYDSNGSPSLEIFENEWRGSADVWDLKVKGPVISVWHGSRNIGLKLRAQPPNGLAVERLSMSDGDVSIKISTDGQVVITHGETSFDVSGNRVVGNGTVFELL